MGRIMRKSLLFVLAFLASAALCRAQATETAQTAKPHQHRWESNLSGGYIGYITVEQPETGTVDDMNRHIAIVKSFWFYPFLPRIVAVGLSFDYVTDDLPLSLNVSLNLPLKKVVPFVSAGVGASISGSSLRNVGGGIKWRTGEHFGLVAEYRYYRIKKNTSGLPGEVSTHVLRTSNYFGAGIAYLY